jgi:hypothetical protein
LPLRVLTPGFLALAGFATLTCVGLAGAGVIAVLALALS